MTQNKNQKILYTCKKIILCGYAMPKVFPTNILKWVDPQESDQNKYTSNSFNECVSEFDLEYLKELRELNNDYSLAPDKIEIKREMLPEYQLTFSDLYNIPIGSVKEIVLNFFDKEKYVFHYENLQFY